MTVDTPAGKQPGGGVRAPRPPFSLGTTVPRVRPERPATAETLPGPRGAAASAPEQVVRVTIERLDVQAVAPTTAKRATQPVPARRDSLAEYQRRRQEAKR